MLIETTLLKIANPATPNASVPPHPPPKANRDASNDLVWQRLLTEVASGQLPVSEALAQVTETLAPRGPRSSSLDGVTLDLDRQRRCGFPEVIYGQGKPAEMISQIIARQQEAGQPSLATRVSPEIASVIESDFPNARFNPLGKTLSVGIKKTPCPEPLDQLSDRPPAHVAVITAGSTDAPVAEEAIETLGWMGIPFRSFNDIGVAGPERLLAAVPSLRQATSVIVIAGMEGALPAAVGGHLSVPVFAVPTSVGYGATLGGLTPLMGMLSCCASNVAVVNIDAGFKAAYLSGLVIKAVAEKG